MTSHICRPSTYHRGVARSSPTSAGQTNASHVWQRTNRMFQACKIIAGLVAGRYVDICIFVNIWSTTLPYRTLFIYGHVFLNHIKAFLTFFNPYFVFSDMLIIQNIGHYPMKMSWNALVDSYISTTLMMIHYQRLMLHPEVIKYPIHAYERS